MDFVASIAFLILYFIRPQDWVPFLSGLNVVKPIMAIGFWGVLTRTPQSTPWRIMTTPHEWVMITYLLYGCYVDPEWLDTIMAILPLAGFYFLTSQSLTSPERLDLFFRWWAGAVAFMCMVGVATDMGVDLTGARGLIDGQLGRLCLNTSLLDNPNALGHTAVTAFPLVFFTMFFRRDVGSRMLALPILILVVMCVVATESKGAYLAAGACVAAALLVGRSLGVQISIAALLLIGGSTVTSMLPRMTDREAIRHDEGVMGRALAFEAGRTAYRTTTTGWNRFQAEIQWQGETTAKATHSSIVQIGADLGPVGLFLYLSIMGCAARSLLTMKTDSDELERARRLLFSLLVGYFVSGWMINRSYHTEFFLLAGAATAFHKLAQARIRSEAGLEPVPSEDSDAEDQSPAPVFVMSLPDEKGETHIEQRDVVLPVGARWNRYGVVDLAIGYGLLSFTVWFWDYLISYFIVS